MIPSVFLGTFVGMIVCRLLEHWARWRVLHCDWCRGQRNGRWKIKSRLITFMPKDDEGFQRCPFCSNRYGRWRPHDF